MNAETPKENEPMNLNALSQQVYAVNTIDALEKSHAELLALISDIHNDAANCLSGEHIELAKAAIANAQPVVTMLREGRG